MAETSAPGRQVVAHPGDGNVVVGPLSDGGEGGPERIDGRPVAGSDLLELAVGHPEAARFEMGGRVRDPGLVERPAVGVAGPEQGVGGEVGAEHVGLHDLVVGRSHHPDHLVAGRVEAGGRDLGLLVFWERRWVVHPARYRPSSALTSRGQSRGLSKKFQTFGAE